MEAMQTVMERAARVRLAILDVDGVLTDGRLYIGTQGEEYKAFHTRDGAGIAMLQQCNVQVAVITGRRSESVAKRMGELGVKHIYQGMMDKLVAYDALLSDLGIAASATAYVGDDVLDLPPMRRAGLAIAVADAHPAVVQHAHWQTPTRGGHGAVRDVCDLIMRAQGVLEREYGKFLK